MRGINLNHSILHCMDGQDELISPLKPLADMLPIHTSVRTYKTSCHDKNYNLWELALQIDLYT